MKRLTIHLKNVKKDPFGLDKFKNTFTFKVKNEKEIAHHLEMAGDKNISKHYLSNYTNA